MRKTCKDCEKIDSCIKLCDDIEKIANKDYIRRNYILLDPDTFNDEDYKMDSLYASALKDVPHEMLECLTEKQKKVIILYYFKGKTQEEIAKELNIKQQNVSTRLERARKKLKMVYPPLYRRF